MGEGQRTLSELGRLNRFPQTSQSYLASFQLAVSRLLTIPLGPELCLPPTAPLPPLSLNDPNPPGALPDEEGPTRGREPDVCGRRASA